MSGVVKGVGRWLSVGGGTAAPCNECGLVECQCNVGHVCVNCQDAGLDECDCRLVQVAIPHGVVRYVEAFVVRVVAEMNSTRPAGWKHGDDHAGRKIVVMRRMSAQQESYKSRAKAAVSGMGAPRAHASPWRSAYPRSKQFLSTVPVNAGDLKTYRVCVTAFISDLVRATIVDRPESVDDMEILVSQIFFGDSVNEAQNITDVMQTGANSIVDKLRELTGQTVRGKAGDLTEVERILILQRLQRGVGVRRPSRRPADCLASWKDGTPCHDRRHRSRDSEEGVPFRSNMQTGATGHPDELFGFEVPTYGD